MQALNRDQLATMLAAALSPQPASTARDVLAKLAAPFPAAAISWRIGPTNGDKTKGKALAYIDSRDVQARLDDVLGADWQDAYEAMPDGSYCCRIGCKVDGEWRWRSDGAVMLTESDKADAKEMAQKGSYSDAFKRAAVKWGIGRYLYQLDAPWVDIERRGNSVILPAKSEEQLRRWLAGWMRANGYGALVAPEAPQPEPRTEAPKPAPEPQKAAAAPLAAPAAPAAQAPAAPVVPADGEPVAATLIEGIPHHMGLRELTLRYAAATKYASGKQAEYTVGGQTHYLRPDECVKAALDAAYETWDAWRKSMWARLPEAEQTKVMAAVDGWSKVAKRFDAAWKTQAKKRAADAAAATADPDTGELGGEAA